MSDAFISVDFDWKILHVNGKAATCTTLAVEEIMDRSIWDVFPTLLRSSLREFYQRCMERRLPDETEYLSQLTGRWYYLQVKPTSRGMNIFILDITDNKKIAEGQDQFLIMANSIPQLGWMAGREGNIHWYNDR